MSDGRLEVIERTLSSYITAEIQMSAKTRSHDLSFLTGFRVRQAAVTGAAAFCFRVFLCQWYFSSLVRGRSQVMLSYAQLMGRATLDELICRDSSHTSNNSSCQLQTTGILHGHNPDTNSSFPSLSSGPCSTCSPPFLPCTTSEMVRPRKYSSDEERKEARKSQKLQWYHT